MRLKIFTPSLICFFFSPDVLYSGICCQVLELSTVEVAAVLFGLEIGGALIVVPKNSLKNSTAASLSTNHDQLLRLIHIPSYEQLH